ncbi:hypothetical protein [Pollutimonas subterranea]|uniref:hypothetical protein n=1 Tax=Pollutimonas subterranea TaxID=2045210 RepID=UPI0013040406|nr:hypothetical protein [Pollutimonas subterranea]
MQAVHLLYRYSLNRLSGCSQHAPNEHLPPAVLREGLCIMTGLYWDMGAGGTPESTEG